MATYMHAPSLDRAIAHSTRGNPAQGRKGLLVAVGTGRGDALESFGHIFIFSFWNPPPLPTMPSCPGPGGPWYKARGLSRGGSCPLQ